MNIDDADDDLIPSDCEPRAPIWLCIFLGVIVTPSVVVGFDIMHDVWLTYIALYYIWVVAPIGVCYFWRGSRQLLYAAFKRGVRRIRLQVVLAVVAIPTMIGGAMVGYHLLAGPLHIDDIERDMRPSLRDFGLTPNVYA